jgi:hypothetical protein
MLRSLVLATFAIALAPAVAIAADPTDLAFPFAPASGETLTWHVAERETAALGTRHEETVRWSETLTLAFGRALADGFEAQLTVGSVVAEAGTPDTLHYVLARAVADRPLDVIVDKRGFVREVSDWPAVKAAMQAALPALTDALSARTIAAGLDRLDGARVGTAVARPLFLESGAYGLAFRSDGSLAVYPNWQGSSAYVFPGRKVATRIVGRKDTQVFAQWSLTTEPAVAAEHVGSEVLSVLNAAAKGDTTLAESARTDSALIAVSGIDLGEQAAFAFDAASRQITEFRHRVTLGVGDFREEQEVLVDLVD